MEIELLTYLNDPRQPRGIRNNNPGNIRVSKALWVGKVDEGLSKDKSFEQFKKYWHGVRALIVILRSYYNKHNLTTIEQIITRWAPPKENDTKSYINQVSNHCGFLSTQKIQWIEDEIYLIVEAIIQHENGKKGFLTKEIFELAWKKL